MVGMAIKHGLLTLTYQRQRLDPLKVEAAISGRACVVHSRMPLVREGVKWRVQFFGAYPALSKGADICSKMLIRMGTILANAAPEYAITPMITVDGDVLMPWSFS